jgi:hypothetical protein
MVEFAWTDLSAFTFSNKLDLHINHTPAGNNLGVAKHPSNQPHDLVLA